MRPLLRYVLFAKKDPRHQVDISRSRGESPIIIFARAAVITALGILIPAYVVYSIIRPLQAELYVRRLSAMYIDGRPMAGLSGQLSFVLVRLLLLRTGILFNPLRIGRSEPRSEPDAHSARLSRQRDCNIRSDF